MFPMQMTYLENQQALKELKKTRKKLAETIEYLEKSKYLSLVVSIGSEITGNGFELQCPELVLHGNKGGDLNKDLHHHLFNLLDEYYRRKYEDIHEEILMLKRFEEVKFLREQFPQKTVTNPAQSRYTRQKPVQPDEVGKEEKVVLG